jgi:hypothetical protein
VREIFKIRVPMPTPQGVAPNQTDPLTRNSRTIYATFALIALLLVGVQRVTNGNRVGRVVHEGNYHFTSSDPDPKQNSPHFDLDGGLDNVEVSATSNIRNSWVEIKVGLIEANAPDKAYHYEKEISYYQGNDSDGFWSEGSPTDQTLLSSIPGGTYFVNLETGGPHDVTPWTRDVSLKILRGVPVSSNFWLAFFAAAFLPILVLIREAWFEGRRWADSNVSGS